MSSTLWRRQMMLLVLENQDIHESQMHEFHHHFKNKSAVDELKLAIDELESAVGELKSAVDD